MARKTSEDDDDLTQDGLLAAWLAVRSIFDNRSLILILWYYTSMTDEEKMDDMIMKIARRNSRYAPWEFDDLVQEGRIAAWSAAPRWGGVKGTLVGWCSIRVNGAMIDYMRKIDPLSRSHRKAVSMGVEVAPKIVNLESMSVSQRSKI